MNNTSTKKLSMHPDQAMAALAHATSLQEQFLKAQSPQMQPPIAQNEQNSTQNAPEQEIESKSEAMAEGGKEEPKDEISPKFDAMEARIMNEIVELKKQLLKKEPDEIDNLIKKVESALQEPQDNAQ